MILGAFDIKEPVPELNKPHALAILRPWIDVGNVGTLVTSHIETKLNAMQLAQLISPGKYFDFTRYRPNLLLKEGQREVELPNVTISYSRFNDKHDFIFLRLLEPHMSSEEYNESILQVFKKFDVRRYCLIGSMYDIIPYTRPLLVTGIASNSNLQNMLKSSHTILSDYQGPTTIVYLLNQQAAKMGIETVSLIAHLPRYFMVENDYRGVVRIMEVLNSLYGLPIEKEYVELAGKQEQQAKLLAEQMMAEDPRLKRILNMLEANYDSRVRENQEDLKLSPEVESFLQEMDKRFRQG